MPEDEVVAQRPLLDTLRERLAAGEVAGRGGGIHFGGVRGLHSAMVNPRGGAVPGVLCEFENGMLGIVYQIEGRVSFVPMRSINADLAGCVLGSVKAWLRSWA
jgi:hypothetical protein